MRPFVLIALVGLILTAAVACSSSDSPPTASPTAGTVTPATTASASAPSTFKVTSTLDGMSALPHKLHWYAKTTLPSAQIKAVDFLIDGRLAWVEQAAPYTYVDGYLVTSGLTPGEHRFTAKAVAVGGRTATDTVDARVSPGPAVPAALAGSWQRTVTNASQAPANGTTGNPTDTLTPNGTYTLSFDRAWIHAVFPCTTTPCRYVTATGAGTLFDSDWTPGSSTFRVGGEVTYREAPDTARLAGWWCESAGPAATYRWSVSGNRLTLTPSGGHDACGIRGFIWAGTWIRKD